MFHDAAFVDIASGLVSRGPTVERSDAEIELLSGGERCAGIQDLVATGVRSDLAGVLGNVLLAWARDLSDTLTCTPCGAIDCELACRFR